MQKNNSDIFEGKKTNPVENSNFFLSEEITPVKPALLENGRRLNDYDFNLLKEDAYKDVSDDLFKLEYKISKTEEEIRAIEAQIQAANDINDYNLAGDLTGRKILLEEDYRTLVEIYNEKSLSAKISDIFGNKLKTGFNSFCKNISDASEAFLLKLPKPFASVVELKKSLNKLENINKSVDELMSLNIPYGENIDKYEQPSKYIIKANSIQNEISKYMKRGS